MLETNELLFRAGSQATPRLRGELRLKIPRERVTAVEADRGLLRVTFDGETAAFDLGAAAEKWARALVTVKSRLDKLGVKAGQSVRVIGVDDASFHDELRERIGAFDDAPGEARDLLFFGVRAASDLARIPTLVRAVAPSGGLWLIRPKGSAAISEADVRSAARGAGLVDVKVASFSATHTADKFVVPAESRTGPRKGSRR